MCARGRVGDKWYLVPLSYLDTTAISATTFLCLSRGIARSMTIYCSGWFDYLPAKLTAVDFHKKQRKIMGPGCLAGKGYLKNKVKQRKSKQQERKKRKGKWEIEKNTELYLLFPQNKVFYDEGKGWVRWNNLPTACIFLTSGTTSWPWGSKSLKCY